MLGIELTHWTIRLALVCLVLRLGGSLLWGHSQQWFARLRAIWTIGCLFFVLHVVCAFQFYHDWSPRLAFESTAEQTRELLGVRFGEGIYFSYLFTLLWLADVVWQWAWPASYRQRSPWLAASLLGYMAFIAFNGAVIFEGGVTRWVGVPVSLALLAAWIAMLLRARWLTTDRPATSSRPAIPTP